MRDMVAFVPSATFPFHDLSDYVAIPRVTGLRLSPDGSWLAASVQTLSKDRKKFVTSIWRIDPQGGAPHRLTRSAEGEGGPRFLPDGSLLFTSKRPAPDNGEGNSAHNGDRDEGPAMWLLPAGGGEARIVASLPGGINGLETAADAPAIVVVSPALGDEDERLRKERKDAGVTAILHETVPVRYWDHDLGPADPRLFAVTPPRCGQRGNRGLPVRDPRPHPGRGPRAVPAVGGAEPGRNAGRGHLVALARWRAGTPGSCADRPRHRQADRAAHRP